MAITLDNAKLYSKLEISNIREKELADIVRDAPIAIAFGYPDGRLDNCNAAFSELTGYTISELQHINWNDVLTPDKWKTVEGELLSQLNALGKTITYEKEYIHKNGDIVPIELLASAEFDSEGHILRYIGFARDITDKKKVELKLVNYQKRLRNLAQDLTISEEIVRKQIAVDLHDNVGQLLSSSRMQLAKALDMEENPEVSIRLKSISQALRTATQATRESIFNLSPPQLNEVGLYAAAHDWMIDSIQNKHDISTSITGEDEIPDLEKNTRFLIFRSIRELITNVLKHAGAHHIKVNFEQRGDMLLISVEDDGVGFNYSSELLRLKSDSYGLFSIQERLTDLGGSMTIDSVINKGTKATLSVPFKNKV